MVPGGHTRNRFDRLAKHIGEEALRASGATVVQEEIGAETQYADLSHVPDPARDAERQRLGLLGRLAAVPCLIEIYSGAPSAEEFRACVAKHLASWQRRAREHRKRSEAAPPQQQPPRPPPERFAEPSLWIITAGAPRQVLAAFRCEPMPGWPAGVYAVGAEVLRVGIVVASELTRNDPTTLLVRLMAAGPLLPQAVREVAALPRDALERVIAEPALLSFQHSIGQDPRRPDANEQEFIMAMIKSWEEGKAEARAEGRAEARAETRCEAVLIVLRARGVAVPDAARAHILAQKDLALLERWLVRASVASSIGDVIDDPS